MKHLALMIFFFFGLAHADAPTLHARALHPESFGQCFLLHACVGTPIGYYDDIQCKQLGGNSILQGSICFELF